MSEMLGKMYTPEMTKILDRMETVLIEKPKPTQKKQTVEGQPRLLEFKCNAILLKKIVSKTIKVDSEVTLDDMLLHDMNNNDDTYDIGTIDFND